MAYTDVDTAAQANRVAGDIKGRIRAAYIRRAITRMPAIIAADDQRELRVAQAVLDGTAPAEWTTVLLSLLDTAGQLASPTDAQLDTQAATAWARIIATRI